MKTILRPREGEGAALEGASAEKHGGAVLWYNLCVRLGDGGVALGSRNRFAILRMRVYLDNCCYNRPFDDQGQMRVRLETEAKLRIQSLMRTGEIEDTSRDYTKWRESQFNEADEDIYELAEKIKAYKPSRRRSAAHVNPRLSMCARQAAR